jgi:Zn-dependent peptidase ImmA (M78 family)
VSGGGVDAELTRIRREELECMNREANVFAVYLLMPAALFDPGVRDGLDLADDDWVDRMARKFRVPKAAVIFRLMLAAKLDDLP